MCRKIYTQLRQLKKDLNFKFFSRINGFFFENLNFFKYK